MNIKQKVEWLLAHCEDCRNDDLHLVQHYWSKFGKTNTESIRRSRARIQNDEEMYPPTDPFVKTIRDRKK